MLLNLKCKLVVLSVKGGNLHVRIQAAESPITIFIGIILFVRLLGSWHKGAEEPSKPAGGFSLVFDALLELFVGCILAFVFIVLVGSEDSQEYSRIPRPRRTCQTRQDRRDARCRRICCCFPPSTRHLRVADVIIDYKWTRKTSWESSPLANTAAKDIGATATCIARESPETTQHLTDFDCRFFFADRL